CQIGLDPLFERRKAQLLEPFDRRLRERLVRELRERRTPPKRQSTLQALRVALADEMLKTVEISLARVDSQPVSGRAGHDPLGAKRLPQPRYTNMEGPLRRSGRVFSPDL